MPKLNVQTNVIHGNCVEVLTGMSILYKFIFADPPFNIDQGYDEYDDNLSEEDYIEFVGQAVNRCVRVLHPNGIMCLHGGDYLCQLFLHIMRDYPLERIAWINWHYRFGQCSRSNWIDARCHCLIYSTELTHTWNPEAVLVESDRVAYGDKRVNETERGGKRLPGTVWGVPSDGPYWGRVQGNSRERREQHPNQLPEVYLARLIKAYTNKGDWVLDPFGGSGTTAVVAKALERNCDTIEYSAGNCESIKRRLKKGTVRI